MILKYEAVRTQTWMVAPGEHSLKLHMKEALKDNFLLSWTGQKDDEEVLWAGEKRTLEFQKCLGPM